MAPTNTPTNLSEEPRNTDRHRQSLEDRDEHRNNPGHPIATFSPFASGYHPQPPQLLVGSPINIPLGALAFLGGYGGEGKSNFTTSLALHVALGRPFLGADVMQGNVLYLDFEAGKDMVAVAMQRAARGMQAAFTTLSSVVEVADWNAFRVTQAGGLEGLAERVANLVRSTNSRLVVIDAFQSAFPNVNPNKANDVTRVLGKLHHIAKGGATVLILDHRSKADRESSHQTLLGSVYKVNLARSVHVLEKEPVRGMASGETLLKLSLTKSNVAPTGKPLGIVQEWFDTDEGEAFAYRLAHEGLLSGRPSQRYIRAATFKTLKSCKAGSISQAKLFKAVAMEAGVSEKTVQRALGGPEGFLAELCQSGMVSRTEQGTRGNPVEYSVVQ